MEEVTAAASTLIEPGIADSTRLGVHDISYAGCVTNPLITQPGRLLAVVNITAGWT